VVFIQLPFGLKGAVERLSVCRVLTELEVEKLSSYSE